MASCLSPAASHRSSASTTSSLSSASSPYSSASPNVFASPDFDEAQNYIRAYYGVKVGNKSILNLVDDVTLESRLDKKGKKVPLWKLFHCDIHLACSFSVKLSYRDGHFIVEEIGTHSVDRKRKSVPHELRSSIMSMSSSGMAPVGIRRCIEFSNSSQAMQILGKDAFKALEGIRSLKQPITCRQIGNFMAYKRNSSLVSIENTYADIPVCINFCLERSIFSMSKDKYDMLPLDERIFLGRDGGRAVSYFNKDGIKITGFSTVFSCKSQLKLAASYFSRHHEGLKVSGSADFTFGIIKDKGKLNPSYAHCLFGSRSLQRDSADGYISQTMRPFCSSVHPTECGEAMRYVIESLTEALIEFEGVPRNIIYLDTYNSDNAIGVIAAASTMFRNPASLSAPVICTLDWAHISRQSIEQNKEKLVNKEYQKKAQEHLRLIHLCRSTEQAVVLKRLMLLRWRKDGEDALADWFEAVLLHANFSVTSSEMPGADCDNQHLESTFRSMKRNMDGGGINGLKKKTSMGFYLTETSVQQSKRYAAEKGHLVPFCCEKPLGTACR